MDGVGGYGGVSSGVDGVLLVLVWSGSGVWLVMMLVVMCVSVMI